MPSDRQLAANRANALKSRGPVTPEGKARSAANARVTHGLASPERATHSAVLRNEDRETFLAFHHALLDELQPVGTAEHLIVREMAVTDWRLNRARSMETALLDNQMDLMAAELADSYESLDHATRAALAFQRSVGESNALGLLLRYTARLEREAARTRHELTVHRLAQLRYEAEKARERSEPNPEIEHSDHNSHDDTERPQNQQQQLSISRPALLAAQRTSLREDERPVVGIGPPTLAPAPSPPAMEVVPEAPRREALDDPGRTPPPVPRAA